MTDLRLFARWKRELRRDFPTLNPVVIRLVPAAHLRDDYDDSGKTFGDCLTHDGRCVVRIADNLNVTETRSTLLHEWAHALRDHLPDMPGDSDHDEVFAAILGRIERFYIGEV